MWRNSRDCSECNEYQNQLLFKIYICEIKFSQREIGLSVVQEVQEKIQHIHGATDVNVQLVFDPPWDRDRMSDEAKLQLGLL